MQPTVIFSQYQVKLTKKACKATVGLEDTHSRTEASG
jgi:hypothetical protein